MSCFNSTLVRLIDTKFPRWFEISWFQFHFGTIDSLKTLTTSLAEHLFQFHFGTIDRGYLTGNQTITLSFQFHFGTIDRVV